MDQLDIAIKNTAMLPKGRLPELATSMSIGETVLRNKVNPHNTTHKLTLREALAMMKITGDVQILEVLAGALGYRLVKSNAEPANSALDAIVRFSSEVGDVHSAIREALDGNNITHAKLAEIRKEASEVVHSLQVLVDTCAAIQAHKAGRIE